MLQCSLQFNGMIWFGIPYNVTAGPVLSCS